LGASRSLAIDISQMFDLAEQVLGISAPAAVFLAL
jgi:hypothetical protein